MIKIEVISESSSETTAAFYYPVPPGQQLPGAVDQSRTPAGNALTAQELQDLKDGKIYEILWTTGTTGLDVPARRSKLVNEWAQAQAGAIVEYKNRYGGSGDYYDGSWHEA